MTTRNITIAAVVVGVLIIAVVAIGQLGGRVGGKLKDPGMAYPAALLDGATIGKAGAPVTLEVYEDFQCPYCAQYSLTVEPVLVSRYATPGTLRIVHHDIGLLGNPSVALADNESRITASGAYCANAQGKYWAYAHWVYNNQDGENAGGFRRERLTTIAEAAGVEPVAFKACLDDPATLTAVDDVTGKAAALGISSTPTMYVNGVKIATTLDASAIGAEIDKAAASAAPSPSPSGAASPSAAP